MGSKMKVEWLLACTEIEDAPTEVNSEVGVSRGLYNIEEAGGTGFLLTQSKLPVLYRVPLLVCFLIEDIDQANVDHTVLFTVDGPESIQIGGDEDVTLRQEDVPDWLGIQRIYDRFDVKFVVSVEGTYLIKAGIDAGGDHTLPIRFAVLPDATL